MRVIKVINNSLVMVRDENGNPCIVSGKGIGFNCRPNDEIRSVKIEQKFTLKSKGIVDRLTALVEGVRRSGKYDKKRTENND